jgi:hypothetical protein
VRFNEESFDDTEHVQAIVLPDSCLLPDIRQPLGMAGSAERERMGQLLPAQQATEAQHDFAVARKASDKMFGVTQSVTVAIKRQAFRCRDMKASYHRMSSKTYSASRGTVLTASRIGESMG